MKAMDKQVWLNNKGKHCPYCVSKMMRSDGLNFLKGEIWSKIHCLSCGNQWTAIYKLADIEEEWDQPTDKEMEKLYAE